MTSRGKTSFAVPEQWELEFPNAPDLLPSPKRTPRRASTAQKLPWESNYAAFSSEFALAAAKNLNARSRATVFDPFVGSGTSLEAAVTAGMDCYGIELNPYNALLSRCRVVSDIDTRVVHDLLSRASKTRRKASSIASETIPAESKLIIEALQQLLAKRIGCRRQDLVSTLCMQSDSKYASETVVLVAALNTLKKRAQVHYRSNPAWLLPGASPDGLESTAESWRSAALDIANTIEIALLARAQHISPRTVQVFPGAFQNSPLKLHSISRFITSPPYLNRLDYVNPTLPELHGLGLFQDDSIEELRRQMMGTTKMRRLSPSETELPSSAITELLAEIASHPTKASGTYYLKFFRQYFADLFAFLQWLNIRSTADCKGILVLQDSYYKDIKIPIVQIIVELAKAVGFVVSVINQESRSRHMGSISPHQRTHAPTKSLTEYTLLFQR